MSCEQCRSDPNGPYTGKVCDWCQQPIGRPDPRPGDNPSYVSDSTGRWHRIIPSTEAEALQEDTGSTLVPLPGKAPASIRAWCWLGLLLLSLILLLVCF